MTASQQTRLLALDGLRGIAAMLVVFYHLYGNLQNSVQSWMPDLLAAAFLHGYLGVHIFFVISGYVIGVSVGDRRVGLGFLGRFAFRRAIRLDPPYWVSLLIAIGLAWLSSYLFPDLAVKLPSLPQVFAHLFYLQNILGYGDIVAIYWTLCLEVQFYLFFVVVILVLQRLTRTAAVSELALSAPFFWVFAAVGLASLVFSFHLLTNARIPGFFLPYWYEFFLGVLAYWATRGMTRHYYFIFYFLIVLLLAFYRLDPNTFTCLTTVLFVYAAGMTGRLQSIFSNRPVQYLGKISYSLYLLHPTIGWSTVSLGKRMLGPKLGVASGSLVFVCGVVASVVAAHLLYVAVERPSIGLSHKIRSSA